MTSQPFVKINVTATTSLLPDRDNHRRWLVDIVWITPDGVGRKEPRNDVEITDPFTIGEYHEYEERQHQASQSASLRLGEDPDLTDFCSTHAAFSDYERSSSSNSSLDEYRHKLHDMLELGDVLRKGILVKINIMEELHIKNQDPPNYYSIHSLLWELLEQTPNAEVQVTRWITSKDPPRSLPAGLRESDKPIHILLVIARNLEYVNGGHSDPVSVAYDTLYAMVKFLGRHSRLSMDVVRPGTFSELKNHLKRRKHYDLVHIDMHGVVKRLRDPALDYSPELCFGHCTSTNLESEESLDHRKTEDVAKLLKRYGITVVVLSACLSSFGQGRLLSNMCRVFARFGICAVTGMNFSVKASTAKAYYHGFYEALVLSNQSFRNAAAHGRRRVPRRLSEKEEKSANKERRPSTRASSQAPSTTSALDRRTEEWQQPHRRDEWPTATTYFAMGSTFTKTNSIPIMGEDCRRGRSWSFNCSSAEIMLGISILGALSGALPEMTLAVILLIHLIISKISFDDMAPKVVADRCQAFKSFQVGLGKSQLKHSVGLMVLENELKNLKKVFIQINNIITSDKEEHQRQCTRDLRDQWRVTNFAGSVEIVPATTFMWLHKFLYRRMRYYISRWYVAVKKQWKDKDPSPQSSTVLIITEVDSMIKRDKPRYQPALDRMSSYIRAVEKGSPDGSYLMITSHGGVDWLGMTLDRKRYGWIKAEYFAAEMGFAIVHRVS
ncbi:hypothetical protein CDV31_013806 [Fusarium ambrosium]|uniref:CHAT domain-containing protein n=1 Tax=Fusarium ambrosium TaxID=131363 RepID=A0A428T0Q2_9HYPO|nr:hypothetical protein CDV31_013806 [Fusarium ambrosium]